MCSPFFLEELATLRDLAHLVALCAQVFNGVKKNYDFVENHNYLAFSYSSGGGCAL